MTRILANFDDFLKKNYKSYQNGSFSLTFVIVIYIVFWKKNEVKQKQGF